MIKPFDVLENHFTYLDKLSFERNKNIIFKDIARKERYESLLLYAFRKYQSSLYHYNNTIQLIEKDRSSGKNYTDALSFNHRVKAQWTANEYIFELSAFLESLKSSI